MSEGKKIGTSKGFLDAIVTERIYHLLQKEQIAQKYFEKQQPVLDALDADSRKKFEEFAENVAIEQAEEQSLIYRQGFLDGLYLGHLAF